tara:strand:- start:300 stop:764 length:465 start_codon:yes stop_codon:yes gene_type:complete
MSVEKKLNESGMQKYYLLILKFILWDMAIYHVLLGLLGLIYEKELEGIASLIFNVSLTITPQTLWLIKPLAAYILVFGIIMAIAAYDPQRFRPVIYAGLVILFIRFIQYISFIFTASDASASSPMQPIVLMLVVIFTGLVFIFLLHKTKLRDGY